MRIAPFFAAALMAAAAMPAFAQTAPSLPQGHEGGGRQEMRTCMVEHLGGLREQVMQHMQQFRAAHPAATREERHAERHAFMQQLRQQNQPAIQAARQSCVGASGGR